MSPKGVNKMWRKLRSGERDAEKKVECVGVYAPRRGGTIVSALLGDVTPTQLAADEGHHVVAATLFRGGPVADVEPYLLAGILGGTGRRGREGGGVLKYIPYALDWQGYANKWPTISSVPPALHNPRVSAKSHTIDDRSAIVRRERETIVGKVYHLWRLILESAIYGAVNISDLFRPQESSRHELSNAAFAICSEFQARACNTLAFRAVARSATH